MTTATDTDYDRATARRIGNARRLKALALADAATLFCTTRHIDPEALADIDPAIWGAITTASAVAHAPSHETRVVVSAIVADRLARSCPSCGRPAA